MIFIPPFRKQFTSVFVHSFFHPSIPYFLSSSDEPCLILGILPCLLASPCLVSISHPGASHSPCCWNQNGAVLTQSSQALTADLGVESQWVVSAITTRGHSCLTAGFSPRPGPGQGGPGWKGRMAGMLLRGTRPGFWRALWHKEAWKWGPCTQILGNFPSPDRGKEHTVHLFTQEQLATAALDETILPFGEGQGHPVCRYWAHHKHQCTYSWSGTCPLPQPSADSFLGEERADGGQGGLSWGLGPPWSPPIARKTSPGGWGLLQLFFPWASVFPSIKWSWNNFCPICFSWEPGCENCCKQQIIDLKRNRRI